MYRISPGVPRRLTHESHGWGKVTRAGEPVSCAAAGTVRVPAWVCAHPNFMAGCRVLGAWHHLCVWGVLTLWTSHRSPRSTPRCHPRGVTSALLSSVCIPHTTRPNGSRRCFLSPLAGPHRGFASSSLRSCDSWVLGAAGPLLPPAAPWQSWHRGANSRKELIKPMCN